MQQISTDHISTISCSDATNFYWWHIYNQLFRCHKCLLMTYLQSAVQMPQISTDDIYIISCSNATNVYWWHIYNQLLRCHTFCSDDISIIRCSHATNFYWWHIYNHSAVQMPHITIDDISIINQLLRCQTILLMTYLQSVA